MSAPVDAAGRVLEDDLVLGVCDCGHMPSEHEQITLGAPFGPEPWHFRQCSANGGCPCRGFAFPNPIGVRRWCEAQQPADTAPGLER